MLIDTNLAVSTAQTPTQVATTPSEDYIDLLASKYSQLADFPLWFIVHCSAAPTSAGAATIQFILQTSADSAFGTTETVLASSVMDYTAIAANSIPFKARFPVELKRYVRGAFVIAGAVLTAGTFDMYIAAGADVR